MEHCAGGSLLELVRARATMGGGGRPVRFPRGEILKMVEDVGRCVVPALLGQASQACIRISFDPHTRRSA